MCSSTFLKNLREKYEILNYSLRNREQFRLLFIYRDEQSLKDRDHLSVTMTYENRSFSWFDLIVGVIYTYDLFLLKIIFFKSHFLYINLSIQFSVLRPLNCLFEVY